MILYESSEDAQVSMGRMGTAWEAAKVAVFLASDEASYINGAIIPVDGGCKPGSADSVSISLIGGPEGRYCEGTSHALQRLPKSTT